MKRIVICADGTWNKPEEDLKKDFPTNVLKLARAVAPFDGNGVPQQVFYDWGVGSYYNQAVGGATGKGIQKNIMDDYRYIVQNYSPGDELYLFGYSRGAYTVRSLCGLINNCGILKRPDARLIRQAFSIYKNAGAASRPEGEKARRFRMDHSHPSREIAFVGAWDTVGALGIPFSLMGLFEPEDEFYDTKMGPNIRVARHAMAINEYRVDFEPTVWKERPGMDLKQVWFCGAHGDIGGGSAPDRRTGANPSDYALQWMSREAAAKGLELEAHLEAGLRLDPLAALNKSYRKIYRLKKKLYRPLDHGQGPIRLHHSVKQRYEQDTRWRPRNLLSLLDSTGWPLIEG